MQQQQVKEATTTILGAMIVGAPQGLGSTAALVPAQASDAAAAPAGPITDEQIEKLGATQARGLSELSESMLGAVRASDVDGFGSKLNELIVVAKGLDPSQFARKGLVAKISGMFGKAKEKALAQYNSVEGQMERLVGELDKGAALQDRRVPELEQMYVANVQYHNELEQAAAQGDAMAQSLRSQLALEEQAQDAFAAQRQADARSRIARVERRVDDVRRAMLLAKQTAPQIRLLQENARELSRKFRDVQTVTIPAWRNAFSLHLVQIEQSKGAALANAVHDATDDALRMNADLLRENTQEIARAKQRAVVEISTLEHVNRQLIGSFADVARIEEAGRKARLEAKGKIEALERQLIDRFQGTGQS